jgi:nucleolar protein 4
VTEAILRKHFEKYGEITEVKLLRKADGKLVGCGFIQFVKKNSAAKAILSCSGKPLLGEYITGDSLWSYRRKYLKLYTCA